MLQTTDDSDIEWYADCGTVLPHGSDRPQSTDGNPTGVEQQGVRDEDDRIIDGICLHDQRHDRA